eukprot:9496645-Pyramimonas_sp.AAC.2
MVSVTGAAFLDRVGCCVDVGEGEARIGRSRWVGDPPAVASAHGSEMGAWYFGEVAPIAEVLESDVFEGSDVPASVRRAALEGLGMW